MKGFLPRSRGSLASACALSVVLASAGAAAAPAASAGGAVPPDVFVNRQIDALHDLLARVKGDQRPALRAQFKDVLDFAGFAEAALGERWARLTPKQRLGMKQALQELLESRYLVRGSKGTFDRNDVSVVSATQEGELAHVKGTVKQPEVDVGFVLELRRAGPSWKIHDVVIDGTSLVSDYRSQFNTFLKKKSVDDLIERLRSRAQTYASSR